MKKQKFKVGERVKVRDDLIVDEKYMMKSGRFYMRFLKGMRNNLGKEATIMQVSEFGYYLDIDDINLYTDDMLKKFVDVKSKINEIAESNIVEVEGLLLHMLRLIPEQQINHALDTGNEQLFKELTQRYQNTKR